MRTSDYRDWLAARPAHVRAWLDGSGFEPKAGRTALLPGPDGAPDGALLLLGDPAEPWDFAALRDRLPAGDWRLEAAAEPLGPAALGWALASYRFDRYRKNDVKRVRLAVTADAATERADTIAQAVFLARDLINTPAADLGPAELADAAADVAERSDGAFRVLEGEALLEQNYPAVYAVGQSSPRSPRVLDQIWGEPDAPKLTLVGKGVCFETGGLDLKTASNMQLMKKDMGGAAVTLGLAQAVMALALPVRLRLLIGAVENSVSGSSFRPGDVVRTRKGLTVEIGNTDAEGRLVLADLLAEADGERPALLVDCATLTGAARVALGPDLPALLTPDDGLADDLLAAGRTAFEPLWRLPLHGPYRELIDSPIADLNNAGKSGFAGAITAALFLERFVTETRTWAHLDIYAW
ncbi:MAG: leucyl aminopeptidase family protein, partial [Geminicoccaceae bacterium]